MSRVGWGLQGDLGFKAFKLATSTFREWEPLDAWQKANLAMGCVLKVI